MNKAVVVGIIVAVIIVIGLIAVSQINNLSSVEKNPVPAGEQPNQKPKQLSVTLNESVGITQQP